MYSKRIESVLKRQKVRTGDRIILSNGKKKYDGVLMPKTEVGDPDSVVIKLDNGYNVGIKFGKGVSIKKSSTKTPEGVKEERKYELGKIDKKLLKIKFDPKKPPISFVSTGGTIASRIEYETGGVIASMKPEEVLHNIPELKEFVNIKYMSNPLNIMSEDMDHKHWQAIAKEVAKQLNSDAKGVIVAHGTDTMHYTTAALSFMLKNITKPVVFVGAQRSSDRGSSDAGFNIICAAHAALSHIAEVGTCMHAEAGDSYCYFIRGTKVRKMHTSRRDAFRPINDLPLAKVWPNGKVETVSSNVRKRGEGKVTVEPNFDPKVALIKAYPGSTPDLIDYYKKKGYHGFVIEGTGLGHVPTSGANSWIETIKRTVDAGIPVVIAPQTIYGRINPNVYTNLRILYHEAGAIPGEDMTPETAYIKLCWVLGQTKNFKKIQNMMLTNIAGEITERSEYEKDFVNF
ncbi:MAG: Glu-tRNA(Gln) amidotransferase subunit GatD [Nanoarchaeota archaeon]